MKKIMFGAVLCAAFAQPVLAEDTPKLHPLEAACVSYELTGQMMNGTATRCHRAWGYESYEIQDGTMTFGGFSQEQHQNTIVVGNTIYAVDLQKQTGTKTINPMYDKLVASVAGKDPAEMNEAFMTSMGYTASGETKTIGGEECRVFSSGMLGTVCMSEDALMLEQTIMGNTRTATSVSIGESGEDENYTLYQRVPLTEGPDLSRMSPGQRQ